jgi:deoxycytidine triphosphate deaminase
VFRRAARDQSWQNEGEDAAEERFQRFRSVDPYPRIPPALLNSADIVDYVRETGMIRPFVPEKVKSASYEIPLLGTWIYWEQGKDAPEIIQIESEDDKVQLRSNDIAFMSPEIAFRIPDYLALRFNLKITHIHRGLLLGTGPLVDPGFQGRLLIPLHNLTANDYTLCGGEGLVWMEFTKLSGNRRWESRAALRPRGLRREGEYRPFPEKKKNLEPRYYLSKAHHGPIRSVVPGVVREAQESAGAAKLASENAQREATGLRRTLERVAWLGFAVLVLTLATIFAAVLALLQDTSALLEDNRRELQQRVTQSQVTQLEKKVEELEDLLSARMVRPPSSSP